MAGPSWLGIGAQRSGTTWFSELLLQHPQMALARDGRKEVHYFDRFLVEPWSDACVARYAELFDPAKRSGDFTPSYLRCLWIPALARRCCGPDVTIVVLLRDPLERFDSAMRWYATRPGVPDAAKRTEHLNWVRDKGNDATWGGMYATHLAAWTREFARERFIVMQYESVRRAPAEAAGRVWRALGLGERPLAAAAGRTWNATDASAPAAWSSSPGLRERLSELYAPEVETLVRDWGVDRSLWPNFA